MPNTLLSDLGEKRLLREIIWPVCGRGGVDVGVGDDAAMLAVPPGHSVLVSTDKIPEDLIALQLGLMTPVQHGRYLAAVNVSDIAAMGGSPVALLSTLAFPSTTTVDYFRAFVEGLAGAARSFGAPVVGGDLGWGSSTCVSATAIGSIRPDEVLTRAGARVGDLVFTSGPVGLFASGLAYFLVARDAGLELPDSDVSLLTRTLTQPQPALGLGRDLARSGICSSCQDVTDGVGRTFFEISEASQVRILLREDDLPIMPLTRKIATFLGMDPVSLALGPGLDLTLVGTLQAGSERGLVEEGGLHVCGSVEAGSGCQLLKAGRSRVDLGQSGWQHFAGPAIDFFRKGFRRK